MKIPKSSALFSFLLMSIFSDAHFLNENTISLCKQMLNSNKIPGVPSMHHFLFPSWPHLLFLIASNPLTIPPRALPDALSLGIHSICFCKKKNFFGLPVSFPHFTETPPWLTWSCWVNHNVTGFVPQISSMGGPTNPILYTVTVSPCKSLGCYHFSHWYYLSSLPFFWMRPCP